MQWLWDKFVEQSAAVKAAPLPFGIALVLASFLVAFATFQVVVWLNREKMEAQKERISLLTERLEEQRNATEFPVDKVAEASANYIGQSNDIEVRATRKEWWDRNIQSVIRDSEKLVVMDSVIGHNHSFWEALRKRFESPEPFHLVYLMLSDDNPFLREILKLVEVGVSLTQVDKDKIAGLKTKQSPDKTLEFYFWEGISPGPLIAWTKDGKETIGLGFWMQLTKSTDGTPYVIVKHGPLFKDLKEHYNAIISDARSKDAHVLPKR